MRHFKNTASKMGFYFGKACITVGVLCILLSTCIICNDAGSMFINFKGLISLLVGFMLFRYGFYRTGGEL